MSIEDSAPDFIRETVNDLMVQQLRARESYIVEAAQRVGINVDIVKMQHRHILDLSDAIRRVRNLHVSEAAPTKVLDFERYLCAACLQPWPCRTLNALAGDRP